ncbi:hypothetical protein ASD54_22840 [Rhizobium sp. Root149]|nr:hypothetical protein ASD54_22840 [Rhizobium sp. Root149]
MSVVRFPTAYNLSVPTIETGEETAEAHESLQAYCRSLRKLIELLGEQVEEVRMIHREELKSVPQ